MAEENNGEVKIKCTVEEIDTGFELFTKVTDPEKDFQGLKNYLIFVEEKVKKAINKTDEEIKLMDFDYISSVRKRIHTKVTSKIDFLKSSQK